MLKWTSESEYFLSFEFFFADTIYIYNYIIQSKSNHFTPSAAHARRGVMIKLMQPKSLALIGFPRLFFRNFGGDRSSTALINSKINYDQTVC